jgi:hypothetical protein
VRCNGIPLLRSKTKKEEEEEEGEDWKAQLKERWEDKGDENQLTS